LCLARDELVGGLLFVAGILVMVIYLYWLFFTSLSFWAVAVPVLIGVLAVLGIVMWIGWTMATTPPPKPIELEATTSAETPESGGAAAKEEKKD
jgi:threonine/homoserine/homoserine lactone efflux protein